MGEGTPWETGEGWGGVFFIKKRERGARSAPKARFLLIFGRCRSFALILAFCRYSLNPFVPSRPPSPTKPRIPSFCWNQKFRSIWKDGPLASFFEDFKKYRLKLFCSAAPWLLFPTTMPEINFCSMCRENKDAWQASPRRIVGSLLSDRCLRGSCNECCLVLWRVLHCSRNFVIVICFCCNFLFRHI